MADVEANYCYSPLVPNSIKDLVEALTICGGKDLIEKAFEDLKDRISLRRTSVSSDENLEGGLFLQLLALIYLSQITMVMKEHQLFKEQTLREVLDELDIIERYEQPRHTSFVGEITEQQAKLYGCFGVSSPT